MAGSPLSGSSVERGLPSANIQVSMDTSMATSDETHSRLNSNESNKRKVNDSKNQENGAPDSLALKRPRRSDQARGLSSRMDSIATLGTTSALEKTSSQLKKAESGENSGSDDSDEIISQYVELTPVPKNHTPLSQLTSAERRELERYLDFNKEETWREDWFGNLAFVDKDIANPDGKSRDRAKKPLFQWAEKGKLSRKLLTNLVRYVYNLEETPLQAKAILANIDIQSVESVQEAVKRVCYDPKVLFQDGWTTAKSVEPVGASGGPYRVGEKVFWQGHEGVVIAYVHDNDIGDLWKAMWLEEFDTFDLEAEELEDAKKRFERKMKQKEQQQSGTNSVQSNKNQSTSSKLDLSTERRSSRKASADFHVPGIEHGIILAVSYGRGARPGVFWPARVVHFSEIENQGSQKRASSKQKVEVVFLAPYWNASATLSSGRRLESYSDSLQRHGSSIFSSGPLFEVETIDASFESIQAYPYDPDRGLDIDQLSTSFRFAGLPKAAFSRYVESHRLALALKTYSQKVMGSTAATEIAKTTASLFEAHPLAGQTACFPDAVLHLPFEFILSQLPPVTNDSLQASYGETNEEPALQLGVILEAMKPPTCWGKGDSVTTQVTTPQAVVHRKSFASPPVSLDFKARNDQGSLSVERFLLGLTSLSALMSNKEESMSTLLTQNLNQLLQKVPANSKELISLPSDTRKKRLKALVKLWVVVKTHGEELISSYSATGSTSCLLDWRRACERIYKYMTVAFSIDGFGNGVSLALSDSKCNLHITSTECFERAVRLPAALKAVRQVAAEDTRLQIMTKTKEKYLRIAEDEVIRRAHTKAYLYRIKKKCLSVAQGQVAALTEDSDGNGGEDTKGTRGSWEAAIAAVAASMQAVDMIVNGYCVNVFCPTRPPGHHAGRELRAMKAVSNGFCLLNNAACAALYATAPVSEGGPGLRRVCVIDIDVHHGNGTQDILCSTYDPRFLYVSIHAGGPDVNGVDLTGDEAEHFSHHLARTPKKGIFPGRCGDSSPHEGVLNIPLGARVTSHALGAALVTKVTPTVERFSPELIIISTGFDAHKNDPLGLGGLSAEDFGTLTEVICKLAHKSCSGRVLSLLEGGYGVPCCRLPSNLFDPDAAIKKAESERELSVQQEEKEDKATALTSTKSDAGEHPLGNDSSKEELMHEPMEARTNMENGNAEMIEGKPPMDDSGKASLVSGPPQLSQIPPPKPDPPLKPLEILDLGDEMPDWMKDDMEYSLMKRLDRCHAEGFIHCVKEHVSALAKCSLRN